MIRFSSPMSRALIGFSVFFTFGQVVLAVLTSFIDIQTSAIGVILMMAAAMAAGQAFATRENRRMTPGEKIQFAVLATLLGAILSLGLLAVVFGWYGVPFSLDALLLSQGLNASDLVTARQYLGVGIAVAASVSLIASYLGAGFGANVALKQRSRASNQ
jgi:hypothetical protein